MRLVTGYGWRDGRPALRWRGDSGRGKSGQTTLDGRLLLGIGPRRCTGYKEGKQGKPCPTRASPSGRQCAACMARDTFRPCMICDGFSCPPLVPSARQACHQIHHLYLASFGGEEIKVGTASDPRKTARLHDQGPLFALRVASGPGPRIKQLEHVASTRTTAIEGMRRSRKLALLRGRMEPMEAEGRIRAVFADIQAVAGVEYADLFIEPFEVSPPPLARQTRAQIGAEPELPVQEGSRIDVEVLGAVGHVALVRDEAGRFLLDLGALAGRLVDPDPPETVRRSEVQLGLF